MTTIFDLPPKRMFPGLGPRYTVRIEPLDEAISREHKCGPYETATQVHNIIRDYANMYESFNAYVNGQYVGCTEV